MLKLPRRKILKKKTDFQEVYREGRSLANHYLVMYIYPAEAGREKAGFAAGKKLGCAVTRNRVKRLLRESYRLHQYEVKEGCHLLLVGRRAATEAKLDAIERAFLQLLKKAGIKRREGELSC